MSCRCDCGYTCSRGRYGAPTCTLGLMECINAHYKKDCDHKWDGEPLTWEDPDGRGGGCSATCSKCGLDRMGHDMSAGP